MGFLDDVRVLDLASVGPAARASRWLADYGAQVVKVGPVPSKGKVQITPPFYAYSGHRGMQRVLLDLKSDGGRETFLRLAEHADVVIESFRPGVVDRLGIGFEATRARNPRVVYCSTTGYGQDGPASQWAGHDLDYLAVGGFLDCSERAAGDKPPIPGATVADAAGGGMHAVMSILAALVACRRDGVGAHLDVSVAEGVLSIMSLYIDEYLATGTVPGPRHYILTGRYACYDTYRCSDGRWLAVAAIEPQFWANLCRALDLEQWIAHQTDDGAQDQIRAELAEVFATRTRDQWVAHLAGADTCVAPVQSVPELVTDAQVVSRGAIADAHHPSEGSFRQLAPVLAGQERLAPPPVPDWSTTDTDDVLTSAGFSATEIDQLRDEGAVA